MRPLLSQRPYSYRDDPLVPAFDDSGPIAFVDGQCTLCTSCARFIARFDRKQEFRICRIQGPLGRAVVRHYGLDPDDPESWLYLIEGRAHTALDGMMRAGARMGGAGRLLQVFRLLPRIAQDWLYRGIARKRYRIFGYTDLCAVPDAALRARLIE